MSIHTKAITKLGTEIQLVVATEEMSELTKELCKYKRGHENIPHIIEEIADVEIMLERLKIIFDIHEEVEQQKVYKLNRLEERLKGE